MSEEIDELRYARLRGEGPPRLSENPHTRLTGAPKGRADAYGAPADTSKAKPKAQAKAGRFLTLGAHTYAVSLVVHRRVLRTRPPDRFGMTRLGIEEIDKLRYAELLKQSQEQVLDAEGPAKATPRQLRDRAS